MSKTDKKEVTTTYIRKSVMKKARIFVAKKETSLSDTMEKALIEYMEKHK